jgi:hypothetical protein
MSVFNGKMVAVAEPNRVGGDLILNVSGGLLVPKKIRIAVEK